ncbi:MAG TPA: S41 family peptidase [Pseudomonadota bacterium]|nr:S41 family peptidase [Rhodanobacteraceae bacterium]MBP9155317.1 S41 family peptidase [Xanthomonadales bacterium]HQW80449.1 S41 family peptidase [Pseudomonadota bacterium]
MRLVFLMFLILPVLSSAAAVDTSAPAPAAPLAQPIEIRAEDLRTFVSVLRAVKDGYVDPVDDTTLLKGAINGVLSDLDPHSNFLTADELKQWDEDVQGVYGGLGIEVIGIDGVLRVIAPIDESPAARAGIRAGDGIVAIDGVAVAERENEALDQLRGAVGTSVELSIERAGSDALLNFKLTREVILAQSVRTRWLEPGYAYARLSVFQENTGVEFRDRLRKLKADRGAPRGLVLDLRDNPGGVLQAAVEVCDALLDGGLVVKTDGRLASADASYSAGPGDLLDGAPVVVLIDGGSASAAEIVAGALKDHQRALIVGQRSFGKGSVQNILPLESGGAIKLTTARYYTPSGHSIQAQGITPDIVLSDVQLVHEDRGPQIIESEATLSGHLEAAEPASPSATERDPELDSDYALSAALNALKAIVVARRQGGAIQG